MLKTISIHTSTNLNANDIIVKKLVTFYGLFLLKIENKKIGQTQILNTFVIPIYFKFVINE